MFQFLSGEEFRRVRRGRSRNHQRPGTVQKNPGSARPWTIEKIPSQHDRLECTDGRHPGRGVEGKAEVPGEEQRITPHACPPVRRKTFGPGWLDLAQSGRL